MTGLKIKYGNVAPGAKEDFVPSSSQVADFANLEELRQEGLAFRNIQNPCELYSTLLDGSVTAFPNNDREQPLGLWSKDVSNADGSFTAPIVLTLQADANYTSPGFTFTFDTDTNTFCTRLGIKWYRDDEIVAECEYEPDNAVFACLNYVEFFDKAEITFYSINMPFNRLRLRVIDYGYGTFFYGNNIRSMKIKQEVDQLSSQIAINTADFTLDLQSELQYEFQQRQPVSIYFNDNLLSTVFVENFKRKNKTTWDVSCQDYIALMETAVFVGGVYQQKNATQLLTEIFDAANVPFNISADFAFEAVTGYIPYTNCREALMQVAFAIGALVDTSGSAVVRVFKKDNTEKQTIEKARIKQGQSFTTKSRVTGVSITSHSYQAVDETEEIYKAQESGVGDSLTIVFGEPHHSLSISNGKIVESGANYAIINASENCVLSGKKYSHTTVEKMLKNPLVLTTDTKNIVSVSSSATLVSANNVDKVLERCYNYFTSTTQSNMKIVDGVHRVYRNADAKYGRFVYGAKKYTADGEPHIENDIPTAVGDYIVAETEFLGDLKGFVASQSYSIVSGRIIVKDTVLEVDA